jgi:hypothetical protein
MTSTVGLAERVEVGHSSSLIWESRVLYRITGTVATVDEIGQSEPKIRNKIGDLDGVVGVLNIKIAITFGHEE